jgi:hypothetical protein
MDIAAAEVLAEKERELGVSAVYFVLVRSDIYNPNSASGKRGLERIINKGHDIGLHFDASLYPDASIEDLDKFCSEEKEMLELNLGGYKTSVISFHRPTKLLMGLEGKFAKCRHVYEPAFIEDIGYCSDSQGSWRFGVPIEHEAVKSGRALHLLTHPIWWTKTHEMKSPAQRIENFAKYKIAELKTQLADHCIPYRSWLKSTCVERPDRLRINSEADIEHDPIRKQDRDLPNYQSDN